MGTQTGILRTAPDGRLLLRSLVVRVRGQRVEATLDEGSLLVGSAATSDLCVTGPTVSRRHAELSLLTRGVRVRDLGSKNGTFYLASRIESVVVPLPAVIRVGDVELELLPRDAVDVQVVQARRLGPLVAESQAMQSALGVLTAAADTESFILLHGEPGTGKTAAALAVHALSSRGPLEVVDMRRTTAEALTRQSAAAEGGTLLLEHVELTGRSLAETLVGLLEDRERRATRGRVIATSRSDLRDEVREGTLPRELYFHLAAVRVSLPPLRERLDDVSPIVRELLIRNGAEPGDFVLPALTSTEFPGNVRELVRTVEGALAKRWGALDDVQAPRLELAPYKEAKEAFMQRYLSSLLELHEGNVSAAARDAGMARNHLTRLLQKHGLK